MNRRRFFGLLAGVSVVPAAIAEMPKLVPNDPAQGAANASALRFLLDPSHSIVIENCVFSGECGPITYSGRRPLVIRNCHFMSSPTIGGPYV